MNRREAISKLSAGGLAFATSSLGQRVANSDTSTGKRPQRPNVLLLITDQHRYDYLGYRMGIDDLTPNIDRLAKTGVSFERAICASPLCTPSRATMFTSLYAHQAKAEFSERRFSRVASFEEEYKFSYNAPSEGPRGERPFDYNMMVNDTLLREDPLLTRAAANAGYSTAYAGKWHLGDEILVDWWDQWGYHMPGAYLDWIEANQLPNEWHFGDMRVRSNRRPHMSSPVPVTANITPDNTYDGWITRLGLEQLRKHPKDKPFFQVCSWYGPHPPFKIPEPYYSMFSADAIPAPSNFYPQYLEPECLKSSYYRLLWKDHGEHWDDWRHSVAVYLGYIRMIDDQIGEILDHLKATDELSNTLVIFCSDHGEMLGSHGLWHKMEPYEESLRVPLIFSAPWIAQSRKSNAPVSLIDLAPTVLDQIGAALPEQFEGTSLMKALSGDDEYLNGRILYSEQQNLGAFHNRVDWRMAQFGSMKYVWNSFDREELYDLSADPAELQNLVYEKPRKSQLEEGREALQSWMSRTRDPLLKYF